VARVAAGLGCGLLFGVGLALSGMISPAKVVAFLDLAGDWDPSLALVMAGALAVTAPGYRVVLRRERPLLEERFSLPVRRELDRRLVAGAAVFGVGWGLGGYCPGPALAGLGLGAPRTALFVAGMLVGMAAARRAVAARTSRASAASAARARRSSLPRRRG
jgi:hypothetical protein